MVRWLCLLWVLLATGVALAQGPQAAPPPVPGLQAVNTQAARFDVDTATRAYMAELSPAQRERSDAYFEGGYWLILWELLVALGVAWLLLGTRLSARMRSLGERLTRWRWLQTAIYAVQYLLLTALLTLPWRLYEGYFREHQYGLSNLTLGGWFGEQAKSLLVTLVLGSLVLVAIYAVIRKFTRSWWLWGAGVSIVFIVFAATIAPVYILPLFNTYEPLPAGPLKTQLLSMARGNDIPATDVYVFDASRQSRRISANVSGMFGTTRISLNDNLLKRSTPEAVKAVLGHEMGHYVLNHVYKGIVFTGIVIVLGFAFVRWGFGVAERRFGTRWHLHGAGDVAGLPLLAALFALFTFVMTPVTNTITRSMEAEADAFGLNAAREPDGFAKVAVQLSEYRKMHPGALEEWLFFDHPSGWQRIHRAMVWKAENLDDPRVRAAAAIAPAGAR